MSLPTGFSAEAVKQIVDERNEEKQKSSTTTTTVESKHLVNDKVKQLGETSTKKGQIKIKDVVNLVQLALHFSPIDFSYVVHPQYRKLSANEQSKSIETIATNVISFLANSHVISWLLLQICLEGLGIDLDYVKYIAIFFLAVCHIIDYILPHIPNPNIQLSLRLVLQVQPLIPHVDDDTINDTSTLQSMLKGKLLHFIYLCSIMYLRHDGINNYFWIGSIAGLFLISYLPETYFFLLTSYFLDFIFPHQSMSNLQIALCLWFLQWSQASYLKFIKKERNEFIVVCVMACLFATWICWLFDSHLFLNSVLFTFFLHVCSSHTGTSLYLGNSLYLNIISPMNEKSQLFFTHIQKSDRHVCCLVFICFSLDLLCTYYHSSLAPHYHGVLITLKSFFILKSLVESRLLQKQTDSFSSLFADGMEILSYLSMFIPFATAHYWMPQHFALLWITHGFIVGIVIPILRIVIQHTSLQVK